MLSGPVALHGLTPCRTLLTSSVVTLGGCSPGGTVSLVLVLVLRVLKASIKSVESIRKRRVSRAFSVSSFIIGDALNADPHAPGVVCRKVTLYLKSIIGLGSFNAGTQVSPCHFKCLSVTVPEC